MKHRRCVGGSGGGSSDSFHFETTIAINNQGLIQTFLDDPLVTKILQIFQHNLWQLMDVDAPEFTTMVMVLVVVFRLGRGGKLRPRAADGAAAVLVEGLSRRLCVARHDVHSGSVAGASAGAIETGGGCGRRRKEGTPSEQGTGGFADTVFIRATVVWAKIVGRGGTQGRKGIATMDRNFITESAAK